MLQKFHKELKEQLTTEINRGILGALPEEKLQAVSAGLQDGSMTQEQVDQVIAEEGIDVAQITEEVMTKFRDLYVNATAEEVPAENQEA